MAQASRPRKKKIPAMTPAAAPLPAAAAGGGGIGWGGALGMGLSGLSLLMFLPQLMQFLGLYEDPQVMEMKKQREMEAAMQFPEMQERTHNAAMDLGQQKMLAGDIGRLPSRSSHFRSPLGDEAALRSFLQPHRHELGEISQVTAPVSPEVGVRSGGGVLQDMMNQVGW